MSPETPEKKTHVVEVVYEAMLEQDKLADKIEAAYARLNKTALEKSMVILGTFQQAVAVGHHVCVIITVQWVNRLDLQEAQMRDMIAGQMPKA